MLPVAFVSAETDGDATANASKKRKKCKKHQKRVKGKCKRRKGSGGSGGGAPGAPATQGGGPQLGDYTGDAVMKTFSVVKGAAGTQGRVYLLALAPSTETCIGPLILSLSEKSTASAPVYIRDNKFSFSESESGYGESSSIDLSGKFTSPTSAEGTVRWTLSGGGAPSCDTGPLPFKVTKK